MTTCPGCGQPAELLTNALVCWPCDKAFSLDAAVAVGPRIDLEKEVVTAEQAMRFAGLLLLADYLDQVNADADVGDAIRGLRVPHWGDWTRLCDRLASFLTGDLAAKPSRPPAMLEVAEAWKSLNRGKKAARKEWGTLVDGLPGTREPARNPIDVLQGARNVLRHATGTRTRHDVVTPQQRRTAELARLAVARLFPAGATTVYARTAEPGFLLRVSPPYLGGDRVPSAGAPAGVTAALTNTPVVATCGERVLGAWPLLAVPESGTTTGLAMLDGLSEELAVYATERAPWQSAAPVGPLLAAFAAKGVSFGLDASGTRRWTLAGPAASRTRAALAAPPFGREGAPPATAPVLHAMATALRAPRTGLLFLADDGGAAAAAIGSLARRLLARPDAEVIQEDPLGDTSCDVVLLLDLASLAPPAGTSLAEALSRSFHQAAGVAPGSFAGPADLLAAVGRTAHEDLSPGRRVWVLLHGLTSAEGGRDLVPAVDALPPLVHRYPWLRLVLSMERALYEELKKAHDALGLHGTPVFANARHLASFGESSAAQPFLLVPPVALEAGGQP